MSHLRDPAAPARAAGVLLAGGDSRRMGRPKAMLELAGRTFLARALDALDAGGAGTLVVVAGRHAEAMRDGLAGRPDATLLVNPEPDRGQLSSLKLALAHLEVAAPAAWCAVVALIDHPLVRPATLAALLAAVSPAPTSEAVGASNRSPPASARGAAIAVPSHDGRRGHPVVFARSIWSELLATPDEAGARAVVRRDPGRVRVVEVDDPGILLDVDTPEDFASLKRLIHPAT